MDLRPTSEQEQLRDALRRMFAARLAEVVAGLPEPPRPDRARAVSDGVALGWFGLGLPDDAGGAGGFGDVAIAHEELGRGLGSAVLATASLGGRLVLRTAPGAPVLAHIADGRRLTTPAVDETADPDAPLSTVAAPVRGGVRVTGRKVRVLCARDVDDLLVAARDPDGATLLVQVPVDADGVEWLAGDDASDVAPWTVGFEDVEVTDDHVVARDAAAGLAAYRVDAMVLAAARLLGAGRAVLDRTVDHVRTRHQFDRPIGTFQAVQHQLADVATDLDATGLAVAQAAWAVDAGLDRGQVTRFAAVAGLAAHDAARRATLVAHQLHGGMGFVLDSPLHLWSARAAADPTAPLARRHLLDLAAASGGISAHGVDVPRDHRAPA